MEKTAFRRKSFIKVAAVFPYGNLPDGKFLRAGARDARLAAQTRITLRPSNPDEKEAVPFLSPLNGKNRLSAVSNL